MKNISPWAGFRNFALSYFMYLILTQIHSHIFNSAHWIRRKINTLKKKKRFLKLCNMRFENIKIWEGVASHKKVITKGYYERVLVNNLLEYLYTAKILSYEFGCLRPKIVKLFHFDKFRMKKKKSVVLLLSFFIVLVFISY